MKKIFIYLAFCLCMGMGNVAKAQKGYKVVYDLVGSHSGWGYLFASNTQTYYYTLETNEPVKKDPNSTEKIMGIDPPRPQIISDPKKARNSRVLYSKLANQPLIYVENVTENFFSVSDNLKIDWQIIPNQTRKIGGYSCQKALAQVRGRNYEAWFTTELQALGGPWKLYNLPGLILEAVSTDKKYQFLFERIETIEPSALGMNYVFKKPILSYDKFLLEADKYNQTSADELHKTANSSWVSIFSTSTSGMSLTTINIEKPLEKTYTAKDAK